ncbi:MAG TPA: ABC transporter substrate-binding protein [Patescibacteria group bacterium]|nr:ABC transporter substrate-binding protein [Patescibacteria group bacterium]
MKKLILLGALIVILFFTASYVLKDINAEKIVPELEVLFGEPAFSLSPYTFAANNNQRLRLIYEPLVQIDDSLNIETGLAVSFGRLDDTTWEFRLNPNANFHNGDDVTAELVKTNFERIDAADLLNSIASIEVTGEYTFYIHTKFADPVLLNKLAQIPITPDKTLEELERVPIGTGQYQVNTIHPNNDLELIPFENYHGKLGRFQRVYLTTAIDPAERVKKMNDNERVGLVVPFPVTLWDEVDQTKFSSEKGNELSVNFFLFNSESQIIRSITQRQLLGKSLQDEKLSELTGDLGKPIGQYVSSGVFGYNPELRIEKYSTEDFIQKAGPLQGDKFKVAIPRGLELFGEFIDETWRAAGIGPEVEYVNPADLESTSDNYSLIFLGWKSDFGDSSAFLENIVKTGAEFNLGKYSNSRVDQLISESQRELDVKKRKEQLKEIMRIITQEDPIGIPLFESQILYGVSNEYSYTPRMDGFIDLNKLATSK